MTDHQLETFLRLLQVNYSPSATLDSQRPAFSTYESQVPVHGGSGTLVGVPKILEEQDSQAAPSESNAAAREPPVGSKLQL